MTTIGEYNLLKNKLIALKPDVVVVGLFMANDLNFNLSHQEKLFQYDHSSSFLKSLGYLKKYSALAHFVYLRALVLNNKYRLVENLKIKNLSFVPVEMQLIDENGLDMVHYQEGEIATYFKKYSPLMQKAFIVLENIFRQFKHLSQKYNFNLRIVLIPTSSTIANKLHMYKNMNMLNDLRGELGPSFNEDQLDFGKPTKKVLQICKKLKIPCIDPTQEMKLFGLDTIILGDDHPTVLGHEIIADKLLENDRLFLKN